MKSSLIPATPAGPKWCDRAESCTSEGTMNKLLLATCLSGLAAVSLSAQVPTLAGCQVFPTNNVWNTPVDQLPVAANSDAYVQTLGANSPLHPDYGATGGYQYAVVPGSQPKVPVSFYYNGDPGPYPIPPNPPIEPGSDHHLFIIDNTNCIDYELFNIQFQPDGTWLAGSGAVFPLNSNALRSLSLQAADAAGLPMIPGMIRYDEVAAGAINHALRFTGTGTANYFIWPARTSASPNSGPQYPPMGQRFRLKASFDISGFTPNVQVILTALKKYGMILADNGASWFVSGVEDPRWNDDEMHALTQVPGSQFEAVDESSLMVDPNSAETTQTPAPPPVPTTWTSIVSQNSGQCLDVPWGAFTNWGTDEGLQLQTWACWGGSNQQFLFTLVNGGYEIVSQVSGQGLDVRGISTSPGAAIQQWPYWGSGNEIFQVSTPDANGYVSITALNSGLCIDAVAVPGTNYAQALGTPIQQWTCWGGPMQKWKFVAP